MQHTCHRCGIAVEDGMPFCGSCGAPQIRIPNQEPAASEDPPIWPVEGALSVGPEALASLTPGKIRWSEALPAAVSGGVVAALVMMVLLGLFGLGLAAAGALGLYLYQRRTPGMAATAGVGARVGAAVGSIGFALFALATAVQVAVFHSGSQLREEMMKAVEQTAVHNPDPQAQAAVAWLKTPDGLILMMALGLLVLLVVFVGCCSAGGALAATLMRNRSQGSSRQ